MRFIFNRFRQSRNVRVYRLAFLWIASLATGVALAMFYCRASGFSGFEGYLHRPTILSQLVVSCLPVLLAVLFLHYRFCPVGVFLVILLGICRGFSGMMIYYTFGSGAWLLRSMLLFSAGFGSVIMWWLIFRHGISKTSCFLKNVRFAVFISLFVAVIDVLVISPFLSHLSIYI